MKIKLAALFVAMGFILATNSASAETVEEIVKKMDANLTKVLDQTYSAQLEVIRDGKVTKSISFIAKLKGLYMKLIKFTAPGDVKGMVTLTTQDNHMYVYMPSYKRVRRVASHVRNQGFMGTDITADDMAAVSFSEGWNLGIDSEDDEKWVLKALPKSDNETLYSWLMITVLKQYGGVSRIEYFNDKGKMVKHQDRKNWQTYGPITLPTEFTFSDLRTGSKTVMTFTGCEVNKGIPASAFTKRAIMHAD